MTGQSTIHPFVLVDTHPDDIIDSTAWVEYTRDTQTAEEAVAFLERQMPLEDRPEEERYVCEGESCWMKQISEEGAWGPAPITDPEGTVFWVVRVVCQV